MHLKRWTTFSLLLLWALDFSHAYSQEAPPKVQAQLCVKLLAFYTNLGNSSFSIHVVGNPKVAKELKKHVGTRIGMALLGAITEGDGLPSGNPKVVYLSGESEEVLAYTREKKVLSVTGKAGLVSKGVSLGVTMKNRKPKVLLNLGASKQEGINWNPAILRIAEKVD